jgi:hypothetical protein
MPVITNTVEIPFTITGGMGTGVVGAGTDTLSGYTCHLTQFYTTVGDVPNYISNDKFVWDFGDGTHVAGISASHVYNFAGHYVVSLIGYSSAGEQYLSTQTKQVSVSDLFPNRLERVTDKNYNLIFVPAGQITTSNAVPITVNRFSSWQSERSLSATDSDYTLILGASGSRSRKIDINSYDTDKWAHLDRSWSYYRSVTADNLSISYKPIDTIETSNEDIYYRSIVTWDNDASEFIHILERTPTSLLDTTSSTALVGTSGTCTYYYADDTALVGNSKIIGTATLAGQNTLDRDNVIGNNTTSIVNGEFVNFAYNQSLGFTIKVTNTTPTKINFTSTGVSTMPLSLNKWQHSRVPFVIGLITDDDSTIRSLPALSIQPVQSGTPASSTSNVVNLSVISSTGNTMSAEFFRTNDNQLPTELTSSYRGMFIPRDIGDGCKISGQVNVDLPESFTNEIYFGFIGNTDNDSIYRITSYDNFGVNGETGQLSYSWGRSDSKTVSGETLSFASVPTGSTSNDLDIKSHFTTSNDGILSTVDTYGNILSSIDFNNVTVGFGALSGTLIDLLTESTGDQYNITPSSIALNGNKDIWVTMTDNNLIAKFSDDDGQVDNYFSKLGNTVILSADGGGYKYEPGLIDTDVDDNIWVAYTHRLSSFITKYNNAGVEQATYEFPNNVVPHDIVVDRSGSVWVATIQSLSARETFSIEVSAYATDQYRFYTGAISLSSWQVGEIIQSSWETADSHFAGPFLITAAASADELGWYADAQPYTGRLSQVATSTSGVPAVSATNISVYPSDTVYKIDSTGSQVYAVSGFHKPAYIVVDQNQDCWVGHDVNTVSKITSTTGVKSLDVRVESSEFLSLSSGNFKSYDVQQIGGISCDTSGNLMVINSPENRVFRHPITTPQLSGYVTIDPPAVGGSHMYRALGDWTGWRWVNKYRFVASSTQSLTGESTINIFSSAGKYNVNLLFEDFDAAETVKSYRFQPQLLEHEKLFDTFYGQIIGDASANPNSIGKSIYYKTANFASNHSNIDECDISSLYSLCEQYNVNIDNYNHSYTGGLKRVMNMTSIPHHKLWGTRSRFDRSFDKEGTNSPTLGINLGAEVDFNTYTITAGTPIVAEQLFNREFSVINTMYVSGGSGDPGYNSQVGMLSSYPLSGYNSTWGWALHNTATGSEIAKYYNFYEYAPVYSNVQLEGLIDWDNSYTNLVESNSGLETWTDDDGIVDAMIDYELRRGLDMFMSSVSGSSSSLL